jgi:hypothetical protein
MDRARFSDNAYLFQSKSCGARLDFLSRGQHTRGGRYGRLYQLVMRWLRVLQRRWRAMRRKSKGIKTAEGSWVGPAYRLTSRSCRYPHLNPNIARIILYYNHTQVHTFTSPHHASPISAALSHLSSAGTFALKPSSAAPPLVTFCVKNPKHRPPSQSFFVLSNVLRQHTLLHTLSSPACMRVRLRTLYAAHRSMHASSEATTVLTASRTPRTLGYVLSQSLRKCCGVVEPVVTL